MAPDLVIGIDQSTTATKAIAWTREGEPVAEGRASIGLSNPQPGWFEQDPLDWWSSTVTALSELTGKIDPGRIAAVAIANQRETFGQFDDAGRPLRPAALWLDERARAETVELSARIGGGEIHRISGKPVDIIPCIYRGAWFNKHMPEMWSSMGKTVESGGYLTFRLTGDWATSVASADPMGLVDMAAYDWSDTLLTACGLDRRRVARLVRSGNEIGPVSAQSSAETGLPVGTPVIAGGGDGQCAGTGTNVFEPGRCYINLGTAIVAGMYGERYAYDNAFRTETAVAERGYIYESCIKSGTFLVNWFVERLFNVDPKANPEIFRELEAEARAVPIGSNGIIVVPYWAQVMTPYWDDYARGIIAGMTSSHRRGELYRAMIEGLTLEQSMIMDQMAAAMLPIDHFVAIGGGASSDFWCQMLADISGRPVRRLATVEASSLGAAMAAAKGAGWFPTIPTAAAAMSGTPIRSFTPDSKAHVRYRELAAIYKDLWPMVAEWNKRLARFAEAG